MTTTRHRSFGSTVPALRGSLALAVIALAAACASPPPRNAQLDEARAAYAMASADADATRAAPLELRRAQEALQQAEAAHRDDNEPSVVDHYAYLSKQRTATAMEASRLARAEVSVAAASAERDRIVLSARTREADAARQQAEAAQRQAADAGSRASQLEQQIASLNAKQTDRGLVLTLGDVLFDSGRATLNPGASRTIDQLAAFLQQNPQRGVEIEGYTDSVGSEGMNQSLSERRAEAVRSALASRGIPMERVQARGFGESNPVATNATEAGRQQNRRIEIVVSNPAS